MTHPKEYPNSKDLSLERPAMTKVKYRPVLTSAQILHILTLCKTHQEGISAASIDVISSLAPFQAKIENSGIVPAYITSILPSSKEQMLGNIGGSYDPSLLDSSTKPSKISKEQHWEHCYNIFIATPNACSLDMIHAAKEHMYLNDMMNAEEKEAFEMNLDYTLGEGQ